MKTHVFILTILLFSTISKADTARLTDTLPPEIEAFVNNEIEFKVPIMTCQQLRKIQEDGHEKLAILDARSLKEFNVSHIQDARRVGYDDFSSEKVWFVDKNTIAVIYCREGKKSEKIGLKLKEMGFKNIYNLFGSITEWAHQDLPMLDKDGNPTKKIWNPNKKDKKTKKDK